MPKIDDEDDTQVLPKVQKRKGRGILAFSYYGGKFSHLKYLLPIIDSVPHVSYVEPFGGSGAVLLNKVPSKIETFNDLHGGVVNFFKVLRDRGDELIRLLELTPYSREEYVTALNYDKCEDELERARMFFVVARQVTGGLVTSATPGQWRYERSRVRKGMSGAVSRWLTAIEGLPEIVSRLQTVQLENINAIDLIARYDSQTALHYVDPPYPLETRSIKAYKHEYVREDHLRLLFLLRKLRGKVVLSTYDNADYNRYLKSWNKYLLRVYKVASGYGKTKSERTEIIWTNFDIKEQQCQG